MAQIEEVKDDTMKDYENVIKPKSIEVGTYMYQNFNVNGRIVRRRVGFKVLK